jgi:hypothetical protein
MPHVFPRRLQKCASSSAGQIQRAFPVAEPQTSKSGQRVSIHCAPWESHVETFMADEAGHWLDPGSQTQGRQAPEISQ